jgi:hypothetical protein
MLQQPATDLRVGRSGRGYNGRVDFAGQFAVIGEVVGDRRARRVDIHNGDQFRARRLPDNAAMILSELSCAD